MIRSLRFESYNFRLYLIRKLSSSCAAGHVLANERSFSATSMM